MNVMPSLPFILLWLALGTAMVPQVRRGWPVLASLSIATAVIAGIVEWAGLAIIILFAGACLAATRSTQSTPLRFLSWTMVVVCAVALASHNIPWIHNVLIFENVTLSPSAEPFTLFWNFDKAVVGVFLYIMCLPPQSGTQWGRLIAIVTTVTILTLAVVAVPGIAIGFIAWDPKWPIILMAWIPANLLITCVAEEAFFRGLLQQHLLEKLYPRIAFAGLVHCRLLRPGLG